MDLAVFAVRELVPNYPYFWQGIKHSRTGKDKKSPFFSSVKGTIKHKKIPVLSTGKTNLGQKILMACRFLERRVGAVQFPVYQAINRQKTGMGPFIYWISETC